MWPARAARLVAASDVLLVIFMAYLTFEGVKIAIDRKIEAEGGFETAEPGDEGGGCGGGEPTWPPFCQCFGISF